MTRSPASGGREWLMAGNHRGCAVPPQVGDFIHCHCATCRKIHGTLYGSSALVRSEDVHLVSGKDELNEYESSPGASVAPRSGRSSLKRSRSSETLDCVGGPAVAFLLALVALGAGAALPGADEARDLASRAAFTRATLAGTMLPYWYDTTLDREHGGYVLADDLARGRGVATEKQIVSQSRLVWGFSHAHRAGFGDARRSYLEAAAHGYRFLQRHFRDAEHGGYFWTTDLAGNARNRNKVLYGQTFALYALVEYARASGEEEPMREALALHRILRERARDAKHGGWHGILRPDWTPIRAPEPGVTLEIPGQKSANATLHVMEALTELYAATGDPEVKASLEETLLIGVTRFFPKEPSAYRSHFHEDWSPVEGGAEPGSFGHDVEFAWLMIRAQQALGVAPDWQHFHAYLDRALSRGFDEERGGLYARRASDGTPTDTDKIWWVQAELLAALVTALEHAPSERYETSIARLLDFIGAHMADPKDGIWIESVGADGRPKKTAKAHAWKASYHDVRALVAFVQYAEGKRLSAAQRSDFISLMSFVMLSFASPKSIMHFSL